MDAPARGQWGWAPQPGSASTTQACLAGSVLFRGNCLIWGTAGREELELGKRQSTTALTLKNRSGGSRQRNRLRKVEAQHALSVTLPKTGLCPLLGRQRLGGSGSQQWVRFVLGLGGGCSPPRALVSAQTALPPPVQEPRGRWQGGSAVTHRTEAPEGFLCQGQAETADGGVGRSCSLPGVRE